MNYNVIDNFLPQEYFNHILHVMFNSPDFTWSYSDMIAYHGDDDSSTGYFAHTLFDSRDEEKGYLPATPFRSKFFELIFPLLDELKATNLIRAKVNFYTRTNKVEEHAQHVDTYFSCKGAILYLNTCNGFTRLGKDTIINSVANRVLLFDASNWHNSTTCSDQRYRLTLNINYN